MPPVPLSENWRKLGIFSKHRAGDGKEQMTFRRHDKTRYSVNSYSIGFLYSRRKRLRCNSLSKN